ncbi:peroxide stress protein YaaA [Flavobacteriales bacterium]|nr:peroxide stress protein YaaA [Flavobacteriales bacterium]
MKIIISPAKSLDFDSELNSQNVSVPKFLEKTLAINSILKQKSPSDLMKLQSISEKLSDLNWKRNLEFTINHNDDNSRPAIFAFNGDVYEGLDVKTLDFKKIDFLQNNLRIISGLYGVLKPLDLIQPYRLEMGTKISINGSSNLYEYWSNDITKFISDELLSSEFLLNLASNEYFSAIDKSKINSEIISPIFKDFKNGKLKIISFYAKKARGMMVRYVADHLIDSYDNLLSFNYGGYIFNENETTVRNQPVFTR